VALDVGAPQARASEVDAVMALGEAPAREVAPGAQVQPQYVIDPVERITGRVVFPPGTPADEACEVVLLATRAQGVGGDAEPDFFAFIDGPTNEVARVAVDAEGAFELPLPTNARYVSVSVSARYLYIAWPVRLDARERLALQELKPELGCWATLRLVPPDSLLKAAVQQLRGRAVELERERMETASVFYSPAMQRSARLDSELTADFRALSTPTRYGISSMPGWNGKAPSLSPFAVPFDWHLKLVAGKHVTVDVDLAMGFAVGGRVVDPTGAPVDMANVGVTLMSLRREETRFVQTDSEGRFRFTGLAQAPMALGASRRGYRAVRRVQTEWGTDLRVELAPCDPIRGRVRLNNGAPVVGLQVAIRPSFATSDRDLCYATTDADGRFVQPRLETGWYDVRGVARVSEAGEAAPVESESAGRVMRIDRLKVMPDVEQELQLIMLPTEAIRLHVVDERGRPVTEFEAVGSNSEMHRGRRESSALPVDMAQDVRAKKGTYDWEGLPPGIWTLWARRPGGARSNAIKVPLGGRGRVVDLVLPRAASVAGRVLGVTDLEDASNLRVTIKRLDEKGGRNVTAADGSFTLAGLQPGRYVISAAGVKYLQRKPLAVELLPGAERTGVVLRVEQAGRVACTVTGSGGKPLADRYVSVHSDASSKALASGVTNQLGEVELGPLLPGAVWVRARFGSWAGEKELTSTVIAHVSPGKVAKLELRFD